MVSCPPFIPLVCELAPCLPNPASKSAMLSFHLITPGPTSFKIFRAYPQITIWA
ncbi:hypothetical protein HY768_11575 [candidate division TA06 bacterium]|uniref:Uncharacterized protein n=1 Tax=candidate division TA06 bacterium TaxID=2250710 RepID=A0A933MLJ2_UNCT6|nr:hypothetical protein [candidate division TA06 bacterium]